MLFLIISYLSNLKFEVEGLNLEIITTPTYEWLKDKLRNCHSELLVSSPFVNSMLMEIIEPIPDTTTTTLLTRTDLRNFALGVSSLDALCDLANKGVRILGLRRLHAKVYVIDNEHALVTSANATNAGMRSNFECGLGFSDRETIAKLKELTLGGFGSTSPPSKVDKEELQALQEPLRIIADNLPKDRMPSFEEPEEYEISLTNARIEELLASFDGWKAIVFQGILMQRDSEFESKDIYETCMPMAKERYPDNQHVEAKLRQQLQLMRDFGIIEFLGDGRYRRLVKID